MSLRCFFFSLNVPPTTEIYTLSLHDALPICRRATGNDSMNASRSTSDLSALQLCRWLAPYRSEEHTSELQSHSDLVCRLLLEKKNESPGPTTREARTE